MSSLTCEECDKEFYSKGNLERHKVNFHDDTDENDGEDDEEKSEAEDEGEESEDEMIMEIIACLAKDMDGVTDWESLITYEKYGELHNTFKEKASNFFMSRLLQLNSVISLISGGWISKSK